MKYVALRILRIGTAICAVQAACSMGAPARQDSASHPNVLLIMTDDQGWWDLACHGNPVLRTPRLDGLCRESVEFTRFYVSPVCSLTRASLMTGRYPQRTGCYDTRFGHDTLAKSEITLGDLFRQADYHTALFGKWHQGRFMPYHPNNRGFDEFFGFWQYGHVERYVHPDRMWHNKEQLSCRGHITDLITDAAINYISGQTEPFFCYTAYNAPHTPLIADDELVAHYLKEGVDYDNARNYALVEQCDRSIGRLLDALTARGIDKSTIVVFLSDNGGTSDYYNAGLRGKKSQVYEGGVLSPLFVRYPEHFPAGAKVDAMVGVIDLLPTFAELASFQLPSDRTIDGRSLVPLLTAGGGSSPHARMYHNWGRGRPSSDRNWAVCDDRYKLVNGKLYDLSADPAEKKDLAPDHADIVARLRKDYLAWLEDVCRGQDFGRALIEVGRPDENPVELPASWATLSSERLRYNFDGYDWDYVDGWGSADDSAEWTVNVTQPGRYRATIAYGAEQACQASEISLSLGDHVLVGKIEATPTVKAFVQRSLGEVDLKPGPLAVRVAVKNSGGSDALALNRIVLTRLEQAQSP